MTELAKLSALEEAKLEEYEGQIEAGLKTFVMVGNALRSIRDGELYRATHRTFDAYCQHRWGFKRRNAYQLMDGATVSDNVRHGAQTDILPSNERQTRPLTKLEPDQQIEAWEQVVEAATDIGMPITGRLVETVVSKYLNQKDYAGHERGQVSVEDDEYSSQDDMQTPPYALAALEPFMPYDISIVWESARGEGYLAESIRDQFDFQVIETGIEDNYFAVDAPPIYDAEITNFPWSKKYKWTELALQRDKPFAFLVPSIMYLSATGARLVEQYNLEIIHPTPRIDYLTVTQASFDESNSHLDSSWLTYKFRIGRRFTYVDIGHAKAEFLKLLKEGT